jgi:hypothetical protein
MRVYIDPNLLQWEDVPHRLFLHPENARDRALLERLTNEYGCTNRGTDSKGVDHAAVMITPAAPPQKG